MECIEARALKSSFRSKLAVKSTPQVFYEDFLCYNGLNGVSGDDFPVEIFLDFSTEDVENQFVAEESEEEKDSLSSGSSRDRLEDDSYISAATFSGSGGYESFNAGELAVPDGMEELEWVSQFVDDSVSELSLLCSAGNFKEKTESSSGNRFETVNSRTVQATPVLCLLTPVPTKARSKRSRISRQTWSYCSGSLSESSSTTTSSSCGSSTTCNSIFPNPVQNMDLSDGHVRPPAKKQKKRPASASEAGGETGGSRRCSHCQVQKTPQWRTGPLGPKTLCNACGVRYKSGRLFPEYRPACSPTFSGDVHSNSHRKVLEMRRKKEATMAEPGPTSPVPILETNVETNPVQ
ncbi:hypothetical protein NMG60_11014755 [Bertholletia excelsa]